MAFCPECYDVALIIWQVAPRDVGTITPRKREDGSIGHTAQIRLKKGGQVVYTEAKTFDRAPAAKAWLDKRERKLAQPGGDFALRACVEARNRPY